MPGRATDNKTFIYLEEEGVLLEEKAKKGRNDQ